MQIVHKDLPKSRKEVINRTQMLRLLPIGNAAAKMPKTNMNWLYATIGRLKKKEGLKFRTKIENDEIFVWRIKAD